jgi:hypothetical protein
VEQLALRVDDLFNHHLGAGEQYHGVVHADHVVVDTGIAEAARRGTP